MNNSPDWLFHIFPSKTLAQKLERLRGNPRDFLDRGPVEIGPAPYWRQIAILLCILVPVGLAVDVFFGLITLLFFSLLLLYYRYGPHQHRLVFQRDRLELWKGRTCVRVPWEVIDQQGVAVLGVTRGRSTFRIPILSDKIALISSWRGDKKKKSGGSAGNRMTKLFVEDRNFHVTRLFEVPTKVCAELIIAAAKDCAVLNAELADEGMAEDDEDSMRLTTESNYFPQADQDQKENPFAYLGTDCSTDSTTATISDVEIEPGVVSVPVTALRFPTVCTQCSVPTSNQVEQKVPAFGRRSTTIIFEMPLCHRCAAARRTRWLARLLAIPLGAGVAVGAYFWVSAMIENPCGAEGVLASLVVGAFFLGWIPANSITNLLDPVSAQVDGVRGTATLRFRNLAIASQVRELSGGEIDGGSPA